VIDIIQKAGDDVIKLFDENPEKGLYLLSDYLEKFEFANNKVTNPTKKEFKSYLTNFDINKIQVAKETSGKVIAIIGTAGRSKVPTLSEWNKMVQDASSKVSTNDVLISGGAAFADHVAVRLFLDGKVQGLKLRLPAKIKDGKYVGDKGTAGGTANFYHEKFSKLLGVNTVAEIEAAIAKGAEVSYEKELSNKAMFDRNKKVAAESNSMIAYTYGEGTEPADGGTKNTWDTAKYSDKTHVQIDKITTQPATSVKEGVEELFDSNPELANAVYETLGFNKVYHGSKTTEKYLEYKIPVNKGVDSLGSFFTSDVDAALLFTPDFVDESPIAKNVKETTGRVLYKKDRGYVKEEYLKLQNPYKVDIKKWEDNSWINDFIKGDFSSYDFNKVPSDAVNTVKKILIDKGYDGIYIAKNAYAGNYESRYDQYIVFDPNKILKQQKQQTLQAYSQYIKETGKQDIEGFKKFTTQPSTSVESLATPLGLVDVKSDLIETNEPNVFLYDSLDKESTYYKNLTSKNSKVVFLHSYTNSEFEDGRNKNHTQQSVLQLHAPDMTIPVIVSLDKNDNLSELSADDKELIKEYWSKILSSAVAIKEKGGHIALPTEGFGNPTEMPQDLFVYLSRELYEKLGYLNPGSLLHKEINDIIVSKQGISDEEILQSYGFESDPFNCA
jgi:hypothetical protein